MKGFVLAFIVFVLCGRALGKECTNLPPQTAAHTFMYDLQTTTNETWKKEVISLYEHLTPTDDWAWADLRPRARKLLKQEDQHDWELMYRNMKTMGSFSPPQGILKEVSLHDVRLHEDSMQGRAQHTNLQYLLMFDVDSLIWSFRKTAGLPSPGNPYGGWEAPYIELRGHYVGHYLSASAQMWASTHNEILKEKMTALVGNLSLCQQKMNSGYLSAFPTEFFDRFEAGKFVWAPYYTVHKVMAGLLDQYTLAGNSQALKMVTWMADYFYDRVQNVIRKYSVSRHFATLNIEVGGMNDVLYRIYNITGNNKYQTLAHLFDKPCFLGLLAVQSGDIADLHANTHIPIVIGAQMRYETVGDPLYKDISTYFLQLVNSSYSYATGGTSVTEFWREPNRMATVLQTENEESCTTYNMLKVSRNLFRWTKDVAYADYYERTLTNGVLSIQRGTDPGIMIYMLPQGRGVSKARSHRGWGTQFDTFWCCYGTGSESFSKLGDSIYFEEVGTDPRLYITQYISSIFNWKSGNIMLNQTVVPVSSWDPFLRVTFTFSPNQGDVPSSTLNFRIPTWTQGNGSQAILNNETLSLPVNSGTFLSVSRKWSAGDNFTLQFPITPRLEHVKDDRPEYNSVHAILYGPYLLVSHSTNDWDLKVGPNKVPPDYMTPIPASNHSHLITFTQEVGNSKFVLINDLGANQSLTMENSPEHGTVNATHATYRLVLLDQSPLTTMQEAINRSVMIEPVYHPGMQVMHQGPESCLLIVDSSTGLTASVFHVVAGLDGRNDTISIESESNKGCYLYSGVNYSPGTDVKLKCKSDSSDSNFNQAASFIASKGLKEYHPITFVAWGSNRNYLMEPLLSFRDEPYTAYLNITP